MNSGTHFFKTGRTEMGQTNHSVSLWNKAAKLIANLICCFIPARKIRKAIRQRLADNPVQTKRKPFLPLKYKLSPLDNNEPHSHDGLPNSIVSRYMHTFSPVAPLDKHALNQWHAYFLANDNGDIHKLHHYFPIYWKHFSRYINTPVSVLEIGVFKGGSLKMWKHFFGEQARIFGVDIDPHCIKFNDPENGVQVFTGDQSSPVFLRALMAQLPKIDILIDDGGHTTSQQITTFLECYDKIADDGVYLCEDLCTNYWPEYIDSAETFVDFAKRHVDYLNAWFFEGPKNDYSVCNIAPVFTNITHSMTFYNSIIVFEKEKVKIPVVEHR